MTEFPMLHCDLKLPLVLDMDGTLLLTDTLHESFLLALKRSWPQALRVPFWTLEGRVVVKKKLAAYVTEDDISLFPVNAPLLDFSEREALRGREVVLATAADMSIAEKVGRRFPVISKVIASDGQTNLSGLAKAEELRKLFPDGFIYAGNSAADIQVWRVSSGAVFAGSSGRLCDKVGAVADVVASFPQKALTLKGLRRSLRLHQWAKNALIFAPLILGGKAMNATAWTHSLEAFLAFGFLASATYLLNDLWDLHEDRRHWSKKHRPLASGELPIALSIALMAVGALCAMGFSFAAGPECVLILSLYLILSLFYSFLLKKEPIIDVFLLATLFTMRLILGIFVADVVFSPWLVVFSMFVFLSLSLAKRHTEITRMVNYGQKTTLGRGYKSTDAPFVLATGISAMMSAVFIMVLYLIEDAFPRGMYIHPDFLWGFAIVIFLWLARIWLICHRDELHDDPVAFALKDRLSLIYAGTMFVIFVAAKI